MRVAWSTTTTINAAKWSVHSHTPGHEGNIFAATIHRLSLEHTPDPSSLEQFMSVHGPSILGS